ncbi:MAG TPA: hypothetical protein PKB09_01030 [Candidatus Saccharibacteria bacterium]|nr:hypothetical protein [Candidatus Saccharibacteria bacterium]
MESSDDLVHELSAQLDEETRCWSGGFERAEQYPQILGLGETALTPLLAEVNDGKFLWWRAQLICDLAIEQGECIYFPESIRGKLEPVRDRLLEWGQDYSSRTD